MAFDVIKNIVDAEAEAEKIKQAALQKAEAIKNEAKIKAEQIAADAVKNGKQLQKQMIETAVGQSKQEVEGILKEANEKCAKLESIAESRKDMAVKAVIRKVVGTDGDS